MNDSVFIIFLLCLVGGESLLLAKTNSRVRTFNKVSVTRTPTSVLMSTRGMNAADTRRLARQVSEVVVDAPSLNSRKITASTIVEASLEDVWSILTDYNNLSKHVPNLVQSYRVPSPSGGIRIFQEGAQKIVGFDFRASLTMDMTEEPMNDNRAMKERKLTFKLAESRMFSSFDGTWAIRYYSRSREIDPITKEYVTKYKTMLTYTVFVRPNGPVPVIALEWRIREDVPTNLLGLKQASEKLALAKAAAARTGDTRGEGGEGGRGGGDADNNSKKPSKIPMRRATEWGADETLGMYIGNNRKSILSDAAALNAATGAGTQQRRTSQSQQPAAPITARNSNTNSFGNSDNQGRDKDSTGRGGMSGASMSSGESASAVARQLANFYSSLSQPKSTIGN